VRCWPLIIGTLVCVAACAGLLGIESPSEPAPAGDAGDGSVPEDAVGPDIDAARPDDAPSESNRGDADDGGLQGDSSGEPAIGVPCVGNTFCTYPVACCYASTVEPIGCKLPTDCMASGGNSVQCDGREDCPAGQVCCGGVQPTTGSFVMSCTDLTSCSAAAACHVSSALCDCKQPGMGPCLPVKTCEGRCN
jgi:hypothetical protein